MIRTSSSYPRNQSLSSPPLNHSTIHHPTTQLQENASSYLLLSCLEEEMNGNHEKMMHVARQSQILSHITELAGSLKRAPRDDSWERRCHASFARDCGPKAQGQACDEGAKVQMETDTQ